MATIDRAKCKQIVNDMEAAMKAIAEKHGLDVVLGGGSFGDGSFKPRIEFKGKGEESPEAKAFKMYANLIGLKPDDLGAKFSCGGKVHTIVGYNPRKKKPIITKASDGKGYIFPEEIVVALLAKVRASGLAS